jgi:hypothetical protein
MFNPCNNKPSIMHELEYKDLLITVHGDYYRGTSDTWEVPGDSEEFEISRVTVGIEEIDITELCDNCMIEIERLIIEKYYR